MVLRTAANDGVCPISWPGIDLIRLKKSEGEYPILLLDDVLSELDDYRQSHLLHAYDQGRVQTFVATTSVDGIDHRLYVKQECSVVKWCVSEIEEMRVSNCIFILR